MKKICSLLFTAFLLCVVCAPQALCEPAVSAQSSVVINAVTGGVLAEQNAKERLPMASTTKIMTALLLAEQGTPEKTVVTTREMVMVEGSSMGLLVGDTVSYRDLLYGMLLASGNDAANTTAIALGGSIEGFAKLMNEKAASLGLKDTHFVTPSGLDDKDHYTTAYDLAQLAAYAMRNPAFKEAASCKTAVLCYGNPPYKRHLSNHNKLLGSYDGAVGVKTGFTKKSGRCLVSAAERDSATLIAVTLNAPDDWNDHCALLDYGFSRLEQREMDCHLPSDTLPVVGGDSEQVRLHADGAQLSLLPEEFDKVTKSVELPPFLYAPVGASQTVGQIRFMLGDKVVAAADIVAEDPVGARILPEPVFWEEVLIWLKILITYK